MKHVICSPGFWESPDANGLFTDIEKALGSDLNFHMMDYYQREGKNKICPPIAEHIAMLEREIDAIPVADEVTLLVRSGGTRAPASLSRKYLGRVSRFVAMVPPWTGAGKQGSLSVMQKHGGSEQPDGSWAAPRKSSGLFIASKGYLDDIDQGDMIHKYRQVARLTELVIIRAMEDEVFPPIDTRLIVGVKTIDIEGADHGFTGEARQKLLDAMAAHEVI